MVSVTHQVRERMRTHLFKEKYRDCKNDERKKKIVQAKLNQCAFFSFSSCSSTCARACTDRIIYLYVQCLDVLVSFSVCSNFFLILFFFPSFFCVIQPYVWCCSLYVMKRIWKMKKRIKKKNEKKTNIINCTVAK